MRSSRSTISPTRIRPSAARRAFVGVVAVGVVISGCGSKNAGNSAEQLITDELQDQIGIGPLEPTCGQPAAYEAGETFTCTAATEDGRVVEFFGEMVDEETYNLVTSNLLTGEDVAAIRADAAEQLGPEVGATIDPGDIVCPDEIILLDDTGDFTCEITDTSTGEVYALVVSTGGIDPGVGVRKLEYEITELLR